MSTYSNSHQMMVRVSAWLAGELLDGDVPILDGSIKSDLRAQVPEAVDLSVPITEMPTEGDSPLNKNGQDVVIQRGVLVASQPVLEDLGTFRISSWQASVPFGEVKVSALSQADRLGEARLESPYSPAKGTKFEDVAEALIDNLLPLEVDPALPDRSTPNGITWEEDRLGALYELADSWPARFYVTPDGVATFTVPLEDPVDPVTSFVDGDGSTVVSYSPTGTRQGVYNAVIARGEEDASSGKNPVQAVAYLDSYNSAYGRVPYFYSSPLLNTYAQALSAAKTRLRQVSREVTRLEIEAVPNPALRLADPVEVTLGQQSWLGRIVEMDMPLAPDATMKVVVEA